MDFFRCKGVSIFHLSLFGTNFKAKSKLGVEKNGMDVGRRGPLLLSSLLTLLPFFSMFSILFYPESSRFLSNVVMIYMASHPRRQ
jgi:hypothetical protein